jgi:cob(I)alamin adenosyltransferase
MKISTRTGDGGETSLMHGRRTAKNVPQLQVCGDVDELSAQLGLARCEAPDDVAASLAAIQRTLVNVGAELATVAPDVPPCAPIGREQVEAVEAEIERLEASLPALGSFILPGGCRAAAVLHVARAVCRRAERRLVDLMQAEPAAVSSAMAAYVNRLGDLLFLLARRCNVAAGRVEDFVGWDKRSAVPPISATSGS